MAQIGNKPTLTCTKVIVNGYVKFIYKYDGKIITEQEYLAMIAERFKL